MTASRVVFPTRRVSSRGAPPIRGAGSAGMPVGRVVVVALRVPCADSAGFGGFVRESPLVPSGRES